MATLKRFNDCGAKLTEDCGLHKNDSFNYVNCDEYENTPFGDRISYNGIGYIETNTKQDFIQQTGIFTVSFKTKKNDLVTFGRILYGLDNVGSGLSGWRIQFNDYNKLNVYCANDGIVLFDAKFLLPFSISSIHTYTIVGDGVNISLYGDGVYIDNNTITASFGGTQGITTTISGDTLGLNGIISDIVIEDRTWSEQEIIDYHTGSTFDYDKNVVSNWGMDAVDVIQDNGFLADNPLTVITPSITEIEETPVGIGVSMHGCDNGMIAGDDPSLDLSENYTELSYWKSNDISTTQRISTKWGSGNNHYTVINESRFKFYWNTEGIGERYFQSSSVLESDTWYFTGLSFADGRQEMFINESLSRTRLYDGVCSSDNGSYNISCSDDSGNIPIIGIIAKFIYFNKPLTLTQWRDAVNRVKRGQL